jgi:hypothetical protein
MWYDVEEDDTATIDVSVKRSPKNGIIFLLYGPWYARAPGVLQWRVKRSYTCTSYDLG